MIITNKMLAKRNQPERTADTLREGSLHNCPYCQCKAHPIYQQTPREQPHMAMTLAAQTSRIFNNSRFVMTFPQSPNRNIVFSYVSPPKRYHSVEPKFNTRKFKNEHFPFLGQLNEGLVSYTIHANPKKQKEQLIKTPPKHPRISKGEKKKNSSRLIKDVKESRLGLSQQGIIFSPIEQFRKNTTPKIQPSKEILVKQQSLKSEQIIMKNDSRNNKQYPTMKSIEVFETRPNFIQYPSQENVQGSRQSIGRPSNVRAKKQQKKQILSKEEEGVDEIAELIMSQLQLNYDYYYPLDKTDKSLSLMIQL